MKELTDESILHLGHMISASEHICLISHMHPDGDAAGSCIGLALFMKEILDRKDVSILTSDRFPGYLSFLTDSQISENIIFHEEECERAEDAVRKADLIICLDFNSFARAGSLENIIAESRARKILIDHHLNPDTEKFCLVFSETEISSTSELVYHILKRLLPEGKRLNISSATALMTGMTTDTNNFANSVFPSTLRMASELIETGVDRDMIIGNLYNRFTENRIRLQGYLLYENLKITDNGIAYMILDRETISRYAVTEGDTEGFVNIPLSIEKVKMSILAKEDTGKIRISIRSKKGVSANRCAAEHFNGGGHELAAGGRLAVPEDIGDISGLEAYILKITKDI